MDLRELEWFPVIGLKVTTNCRMHCLFCLENSRHQEYGIEDYINLIRKLANAGTKRFCITGGEPLLSPSLNMILKESADNGIENILVT